jgi:hypothetical protein
MKKTIFTLLIILGTVAMLQAQFAIKPAVGFNTSHLTTENVKWGAEGRVGYQFGVGVLVGEKLYFEPGIFWNTTSKDVYDKTSADQVNFSHSTSFIRIPAVIGYHILGNEESLADLRFFAGPAASFITSVKDDTGELSKDEFKSMIFDITAGVGVDIWIFFVEWNYVFGLTPVFKDGHNNAKDQIFNLNVGARFRF